MHFLVLTIFLTMFAFLWLSALRDTAHHRERAKDVIANCVCQRQVLQATGRYEQVRSGGEETHVDLRPHGEGGTPNP